MSKILVEKHRPDSIEGYVGNEHIKEIIKQFISNESRPNLLLSGPPGTGKTTMARILHKNIDCDYIIINASDENGIDTIREKIKGFCSVASFQPIKLVILEEADHITLSGQAALRYIIETYSNQTRFILTCNYADRIIPAIQSRCTVLKVIPPSKPNLAQHLVDILDKENIKYQANDVVGIVNKNYPDIRKMINNIQLFTKDNNLSIPDGVIGSSNYTKEVIKELKNSKPDWINIRKIISSSNQSSYEDMFRELYDNVEKILPENYSLGVIYIEQYQFQSQFSVDKEINIIACITKLIELK